MNPQIFYYIFTIFLASCSLLFFIKSITGTSISGKVTGNRYGILSKYMNGNKAGDTDSTPISLYQIIRFILFGIWLATLVILKITKNLPTFNMQLALLILLFTATIPRQALYNLKLPLFYVKEFIQKRRKQILNREIYHAISQMINLFNVKVEESISSNYIFEEIIKFAGTLRPIYYQMLSLWNMNRREEAADYFAREVDTKEAKNLASVFLKLDYLSPKELKNQLIHYQNNMRTEKITLREKINERNGNLMYILAIISAIVVLLNFLVIVLVVEVFSSYSMIYS